MTGSAGQRRVPRYFLESLSIPLPSLREQRRIAAILDTADRMRELRRQSIAKLDTLLKAVFLEMFGNPVTNPKRWPVIKLGDCIINGPQNGLYKPSSEYGEGTPTLRIDSFYDGVISGIDNLKRVRLNESERNLYSLAENDIVINRVNSLSHLGKSAIVPKLSELTVFESNMMRMSFDISRIHPVFMIHYLQSNHIKSQIMNCAKNAVNQSSINQTDVKGFRIFEPSIELQQSFAALVSNVRKLQEKYSKSRELNESLFRSLQQRAFTGRLFTDKALATAQQELFAG